MRQPDRATLWAASPPNCEVVQWRNMRAACRPPPPCPLPPQRHPSRGPGGPPEGEAPRRWALRGVGRARRLGERRQRRLRTAPPRFPMHYHRYSHYRGRHATQGRAQVGTTTGIDWVCKNHWLRAADKRELWLGSAHMPWVWSEAVA